MNDCLIKHFDEDKIVSLKNEIEENEKITDITNIFSAMSEPNRLKILFLLIKNDLCVCDLEEIIGVSQSSISHHLRVLKDYKIVKFQKKGKRVYYSLDDEHIVKILTTCKEHIEE